MKKALCSLGDTFSNLKKKELEDACRLKQQEEMTKRRNTLKIIDIWMLTLAEKIPVAIDEMMQSIRDEDRQKSLFYRLEVPHEITSHDIKTLPAFRMIDEFCRRVNIYIDTSYDDYNAGCKSFPQIVRSVSCEVDPTEAYRTAMQARLVPDIKTLL